MADRFFWQHSFPAASILLMCLLAQYTLCFFLVAIFHQLLSTRERASYYLKQPSPSLPWYGLIFQPFSDLFSAGSFSEEEVRTPRTRRRSPHSPLIYILKAFLAPLPFIFETSTLCFLRSFLRRLQPALIMTIPHTCRPMRRCRCPTFCSLAHPACFRKALRTLFVHTDRTVVSPFRTSNVIRSVRSSV